MTDKTDLDRQIAEKEARIYEMDEQIAQKRTEISRLESDLETKVLEVPKNITDKLNDDDWVEKTKAALVLKNPERTRWANFTPQDNSILEAFLESELEDMPFAADYLKVKSIIEPRLLSETNPLFRALNIVLLGKTGVLTKDTDSINAELTFRYLTPYLVTNFYEQVVHESKKMALKGTHPRLLFSKDEPAYQKLYGGLKETPSLTIHRTIFESHKGFITFYLLKSMMHFVNAGKRFASYHNDVKNLGMKEKAVYALLEGIDKLKGGRINLGGYCECIDVVTKETDYDRGRAERIYGVTIRGDKHVI